MDDDKITLQAFEYGRTTITVDRVEYEAARAAGEVDQLLDARLSDIDTDTLLVEEDGTAYDPYRDFGRNRPSLLGTNVTAALAEVIRAARPGPDCPDCRWSVGRVAAGNARGAYACPRHVAEHLVEAVRAEHLIVMPMVEADRVVAAAVERQLADRP